MNIKQEDIEVMAEILNYSGIIASDQTVKNIAMAFKDHIDFCNEIQLNGIIDKTKKCTRCEQLEREIEELKNNIDIFKNSVKNEPGL